jgi:hypothetical protein
MSGRKRGRPPGRPQPSEPERIAQFNVWMYSVDGPRLFEAGEPIPDGYVDSPAKVSGHGDR